MPDFRHLRPFRQHRPTSKFESLIQQLRNLYLPLKESDFAIYGSAPLVVKGIQPDCNDLDIIVKPEKWCFDTIGNFKISDLQFYDSWPDEDVTDLIDNHTFIWQGLRFVNVDKVIGYKSRWQREKDRWLWEDT